MFDGNFYYMCQLVNASLGDYALKIRFMENFNEQENVYEIKVLCKVWCSTNVKESFQKS